MVGQEQNIYIVEETNKTPIIKFYCQNFFWSFLRVTKNKKKKGPIRP